MSFSYLIISWYEENKRDLPWRHTSDPYLIWVSEIILQQTRVEQGMSYYHRFIERFPDVGSLAEAEEEEVIKVWQGLGYYSRARNLHQSAKTIVHGKGSGFPASYDELIRMKGVGDYSASAVSSIAYGEARPVVDGNVLRVIARYEGVLEPVNTDSGRKKVRGIVQNYIDPSQPGIFNQAIMELGALVCRPKQPLCLQCPIMQECYAYRNEKTSLLPVLTKAKATKVRFFNYLVIFSKTGHDNYIWLRKRTGEDIWKNLYDFPLIETDSEFSPEELMKTEPWKKISGGLESEISQVIETSRHKLTHRELRIKFFSIINHDYHHPEYLKINFKEIHKYPVPRPIEAYLKNISIRPGIFFKFPD